MTPTDVLAAALKEQFVDSGDGYDWKDVAADIFAALPEGWVLTNEEGLATAICESGEVYADCRHRENEDDVAAGLPLVRVTKDCEPAYHRHRAAAIIKEVRGE